MEKEYGLNFEKVMEGSIDEYLSGAIHSYCVKIPSYTEAKARKAEMFEQYPKLKDFIDKGIVSALTEEECERLLEIVKMEMKELWLENRACYFRGVLDGTKLKESFE